MGEVGGLLNKVVLLLVRWDLALHVPVRGNSTSKKQGPELRRLGFCRGVGGWGREGRCLAWQRKRARFATGQAVKVGTEVALFTSRDALEAAEGTEL